jgi:hypothetical protein
VNEPLDDEADLLAELRDAGRLDPVPTDALAAAKAAFMWRTIDAELAELTYDSLLDDQPLAGVRSSTPARFLSFASDPANLSVELEAITEGERRRLVGQLVPAQRGQIEVRHAGGAVTVEVDDLGRFTADDLAPGPISLHCRAASGATVATDWVLV